MYISLQEHTDSYIIRLLLQTWLLTNLASSMKKVIGLLQQGFPFFHMDAHFFSQQADFLI